MAERFQQLKQAKGPALVYEQAHSAFTFVQASNAHQEHPERNEDYLLIDRRSGLAVVCDGVGSVIGADEAARIAARTIKRRWRRMLSQVPDPSMPASARGESLDLDDALCRLLENANKAVLALEKRLKKKEIKSDDENKDAGYAAATVALALFYRDHDGYFLAYDHIGDSRVYLLRKDEDLRRLTIDDGYFLLQQNKGELSEQDALRIDQASSANQLSEKEREHFEKRNVITQSLGGEKLTLHSGQIELCPGDRVLLCTDGVHDNLTDTEIEAILRTGARTTVAKALLRRAYTRSQQDKEVHMRAKKDDMSAIAVTYHPPQ